MPEDGTLTFITGFCAAWAAALALVAIGAAYGVVTRMRLRRIAEVEDSWRDTHG